jgi:spore coat polysaccharide biosynthesis protein SpsF
VKNILIRCDASKEIGLGHITRCLVLANELRDDKNRVYFAIRNYEISIEKLKEQQFDMLIADDDFDYFNWIEEIVKEKEIDIFIGDVRDDFPIELISYMKNKNILTVAIDEPSSYAKECDLCFYPPHANIDKSKYKGKVFQGLEYVILRSEFYEKFEKTKNEIPNILVMMGGTDVYNLSYVVVEKLHELNENIEILVILNKNHQDYKKIKKLGKNIHIYSDIKNMADFLFKIDFAVITFGVSAYEMLIMNIPTVHICLNQEHYESSNFFLVNKYATRYKIEEINKIVINKKEINQNCIHINKIKNRILNATF